MDLQQDEKIIMQTVPALTIWQGNTLYDKQEDPSRRKNRGLLSKTTEVKLDKFIGTIKAVSAPGENSSRCSLRGVLNNKHPCS